MPGAMPHECDCLVDMRCYGCEGTGTYPDAPFMLCDFCQGTGFRSLRDMDEEFDHSETWHEAFRQGQQSGWKAGRRDLLFRTRKFRRKP